jgi:hypothetical protein
MFGLQNHAQTRVGTEILFRKKFRGIDSERFLLFRARKRSFRVPWKSQLRISERKGIQRKIIIFTKQPK